MKIHLEHPMKKFLVKWIYAPKISYRKFVFFRIDLTKQQRPDLKNSVLFHGVTYLGSASINVPRSEEELNR